MFCVFGFLFLVLVVCFWFWFSVQKPKTKNNLPAPLTPGRYNWRDSGIKSTPMSPGRFTATNARRAVRRLLTL
jgi:hypothetical protein